MKAVALAALLSISSAPFQCGGGNAPAREETAGDALWALSEDFEAKGDHAAARRTLEYLVKNHPSSRHADAAKRKLDGSADGG
jgi:hypothetical protein